MKIRIIFLAILSCLVCRMSAENLTAADSAYAAKDYDRAIALYLEVEKTQGKSAQLLYNLGNAYYEAQQPAKAVVCYERALKIKPGDKQILNNLEFVHQRVQDKNLADLGGKLKKVEYDDATFTDAFYNWVAKGTASDNWAILAAMAFVLAIGCAAVYFFAKLVMARKMGFFLGFIFLIFSVLFILFAHWSQGYSESSDEAVVTIFKTPLLAEPSTSAESCTTPVNAGSKVQILESLPEGAQTPEWYKVKMNSDFIGWIQAKDIEII